VYLIECENYKNGGVMERHSIIQSGRIKIHELEFEILSDLPGPASCGFAPVIFVFQRITIVFMKTPSIILGESY